MLLPVMTNFEDQIFDYVIPLEEKEDLKQITRQDNRLLNQKFTPFQRDILDREILSLRKKPYLYRQDQQDVILGLHNNFWSKENNQKYYGVTTIEQWGNNSTQKLSLKKLNYLDSAPMLPQGTSALTISGGGKKNLIQQNDLLEEFTDFRGGVAFHQGLAEDVTFGAGFVYEDLLLSGFSQFTYQPDNLPLKTTVSLIDSKQGLSLYSHLQLKPVKTVIIDFYGDEAQQEFALNWKISPGLKLIATGDSQQKNLRPGGEFAVKNNFLSLLGKAEVSKNNEIQWQVTSQIDRLRLTYKASAVKTNSKFDYVLGNFNNKDWQSSLFLKNQTSFANNSTENLAIWGWHFQTNSRFPWFIAHPQSRSNSKLDPKNYLWKFDLGYGLGSQGKGAIISTATSVKSGLYLKLSYESISLTSDEAKIQLKLTSKP